MPPAPQSLVSLPTREPDCAGVETLSVALEQVFLRDATGRHASLSTFDNEFWARYLDVFERVRIVARVQVVNHFPLEASELSDPRVTVVDIPFYRGPFQYLRRSLSVRRALARVARLDGTWILRLPGVVGMDIARRLDAAGRAYAVELVGDPYEILQPGVAGSPLTRPLVRPWLVRGTRRACARARAVAYVSRHVLERRYPAAPGAITEAYSSINLPSRLFAARPRSRKAASGPLRLLTVGSLAYQAKGVDVLLHACAQLMTRNVDARIEIVGDGVLRDDLVGLSQRLGLADRVTFSGHLARDQVLDRMDQCDIFVLASRSEGLPRVLIEAMARGAPCVATHVGGIPELLPDADLVAPNDPAALADRLADVACSPKLLAEMSSRNLERARDYDEETLSRRRQRFYASVRESVDAD